MSVLMLDASRFDQLSDRMLVFRLLSLSKRLLLNGQGHAEQDYE